VFCCFNNNYKIVPSVFDCWMRILRRVEGSVLWLLENNKATTGNLIKEASARGVNPERLVFAQIMPLADHLARLRSADLFLDTLPYNAHTTASDALWAGVPVLTCIGETFAGRVAASLLNAVGLSELIASSRDDYERSAVELATDRQRFSAIKAKLQANRLAAPLFDTERFTRHIETAYAQMYERHRAGLAPDHFVVSG
jgi:predicted O-linked N-acetylglucosamine transferase (SPINDLY family)